jgi:DEAD/DEAH box helicase domain-containing protein
MTTIAQQYENQVQEYIASLKASPKFGPQVVYHKTFADTKPVYADTTDILSTELTSCLREMGIETLYSHQAEAITKILSNQDVVVATPTSSGKSLVYMLPVLEKILKETTSHALFLFPLKALSQDQLKSLKVFQEQLSQSQKLHREDFAAIYDGDTSSYRRRKIRQQTPPILITNPDMLHLSFLPFHENWSHFFRNLDYVVIDEVHSYRGIFGSHIAWLLRRLQRVTNYYGKRSRFILSSATIGNPKTFAKQLIGGTIESITQTGAPQSKKHFLLLNPWDSPAYTASRLLEAAIKRGLRTIVYTQSRKMTELISLWTLPKLGSKADKLSSYRAGFLAEERRVIERRLSSGELLGVIATSALELGIDIGHLDICILVGYPGSIMATHQRGGRVGRRDRESAVILIGSEDALDQYYMNNPLRFFAGKVESAVLNPGNTKIIRQHLVCAAAEIPLHKDEDILVAPEVMPCIDALTAESALLLSADGLRYHATRKRPQRYVHLRGTGNALTIINSETGQILGEIDAARALQECHEGAVYLHRMKTWLVEKLDLVGKEVVVGEKKLSYYTRSMSNKNTEIIAIQKERTIFGCQLCFGTLKVSQQVTGYQKKNNGSNTLVATFSLDLPVQTMETEGIWLDIPTDVVRSLEEKKHHFMGGLHALEHVMISIFPLLVLCDRNDVGGISCPLHEQTKGATIFIYDGHAGGSGLSAEAYNKAEELLQRSLEIVVSCDCSNGCPACVHSPKCGSGNRPIDKSACLFLLEKIFSATRPGKERSDLRRTPIPAHYKALEKKVLPSEGIAVLPDHFGVFDLETKFSAEEVGGWHNIEKMGMSLGVVFDSVLDGYVTYLEDEIESLIKHLQSLQLVVGFNNKNFDNRVLYSYGKPPLDELPTLDLLEEIKKHLGYRLSLNSVAEHTLNVKKSGDGLMALQWYRQKNYEMLRKYCMKDVEITKNIMIFALQNGFLLFQNKARQKVRLPLDLEKTILAELHKIND